MPAGHGTLLGMTNDVLDTARRAREAAVELGLLNRAAKDAALLAMADALEQRCSEVLVANATDVDRGRAEGMTEALVDRLSLTGDRVTAMADGLRQVAALPDPVGEVVRGSTLANGLEMRQIRVPMGVIGMIYEARPNVTVDAAGLAVKSGNAVLLRGSASARTSNIRLVNILALAGTATGLPPHAIQLVPGTDHDSVKQLMRARGLVDVLIPRGGAGLIRSVVEESTVPVIETG
ncbi:MAG: aldehyde dehydrogenase family protein, partial [Frankiaceae bacterium]